MRVRDKGFLLWLVWAFFDWRGVIKRLPYAIAFFSFSLLVNPYVTIAAQTVAVYFLPPPAGVELDPAYVRQVASSLHMIPFLLPICYMFTVLDMKRLRSIEAPRILAVIFALVSVFVPIFAPAYAEMSAMTVFAYHAILAVIPAKEDRLSPSERKYRTWQAIATGDGTPRRLSGRDIKTWHIVSRPE